MNHYEKILLQLSFENYKKTNSLQYQFQPRNANELFYYTEAAAFLYEKNFIVPLSDNILEDCIDISSSQGTLIIFELTDSGIHQAKALIPL